MWVVLLSAAGFAFARDGVRDGLRTLAADLAVAFASRGAATVAAMWVWWRSSWWAATAYPVYVLGLLDVALLFAALALAGGLSPSASASEAGEGGLTSCPQPSA